MIGVEIIIICILICVNYQVKKVSENNIFLSSYCTLVCERVRNTGSSLYDHTLFKLHKYKEMQASNHRGDTSLHYVLDRTEITKGNCNYNNSQEVSIISHKAGCILGTQDENLTYWFWKTGSSICRFLPCSTAIPLVTQGQKHCSFHWGDACE